MKTKLMKCMALILSLVCLLSFPVQASATAQGTEGTEQEVVQPQQLEIFLGEAWAGVEFQLRTDAGKYPEAIPVGENGILSLEIGGSEHYFLTCQATQVEVPEPEAESDPMDETEQTDAAAGETVEDTAAENTENAESTDATETTEVTIDEVPQDTVPTTSIVIFAFGLLIAIAALVLMQMHQKRNKPQDCDADDDL